MDLIIQPTKELHGEITAPGSKSYSHRAFIAAALAEGVSVIKNPITTGDVGITLEILKDLSIKILKESESSYVIEGKASAFKPVHKTINCGNSGTSLRIFSALSLLVEGGLKFRGEFIKRNRPILPLLDALKYLGADYKISKSELSVQRLRKACDHFKIAGDISSQFITALLMLIPVNKCNNVDLIELRITSPIVSYPYVQITLDVLRSFGINILEKLDESRTGMYVIETNQNFRTQVYDIPGDFSSAAFMIAAGALSKGDNQVTIKNLDINNPQGDKKIIEILKEMGAKIEIDQANKTVSIKGNNPLKGIDVNCYETPDLFPILAVLGALAEDKMTLYNASNLRKKESDRIAVMARELKKMGVQVEEEEDRLTIYHCDTIIGSRINHEDDHRIAMAGAILSLSADSECTINNIDIVKDSYPQFIEDLKNIGANLKTN